MIVNTLILSKDIWHAGETPNNFMVASDNIIWQYLEGSIREVNLNEIGKANLTWMAFRSSEKTTSKIATEQSEQ